MVQNSGSNWMLFSLEKTEISVVINKCRETADYCSLRVITVKILCIGTDRSQQTVQTKIRVYAVCHSISIFWMH